MKSILIISGVAVIALVGLFVIGNRGVAPTSNPQQAILASLSSEDKKVVLYKSPTCGCCGLYVGYLKSLGFDVEVRDTVDMNTIITKYAIPASVKSCHTTIAAAGKYYIEGHVAIEAISKLLTEKPAVKGIGLGGMPAGTPGMPGNKNGAWDVQKIDDNDQLSTFMSI